MSKLKIVCYGAGLVFNMIKNRFNFNYAHIVAVIDKKAGTNYTTPVGGEITLSPEQLKDIVFDYVLVCSEIYYHEMIETLNSIGVPECKIIVVNADFIECYNKLFTLYTSSDNMIDEKIKVLKKITYHLFRDSYKVFDMSLSRERCIKGFNIQAKNDYVRLSTLELIAWQINSKNISGHCAELGVYQGDFAKIINELFPSKDLYLFDTFCGFDSQDVEYINGSGEVNESEKYFFHLTEYCSDSSVELVLSKIMFKDKVHICKGKFPNSIINNNIYNSMRFAFVSIDVDIYPATLEGLKYFYPRLEKGGYIMVHDYQLFEGVASAVDEYCKNNNITVVPLSDTSGSAVLIK